MRRPAGRNTFRSAGSAHGNERSIELLDTNTTLHFTRFDKVPWQKVFGKGTAVMVPHVVVDEINTKS
ncbi:hypothetical protein AB0H23_27275 [Streptomyces albogriseolus]|uniref:hypothetical protein n=1 Tax=Streptomyces albogriseolus TaxID=1887 RepID=UPI00345FBE7E